MEQSSRELSPQPPVLIPENDTASVSAAEDSATVSNTTAELDHLSDLAARLIARVPASLAERDQRIRVREEYRETARIQSARVNRLRQRRQGRVALS